MGWGTWRIRFLRVHINKRAQGGLQKKENTDGKVVRKIAVGGCFVGYFCPTPRKGLIGGEGLISLLSEVGEEAGSSDSDDLPDIVRRLASFFRTI